jgi:hypothetical protein
MLRQTDPAFTVLLAAHQRPEIEEMDDSRVIFLKARWSLKRPMRDKR